MKLKRSMKLKRARPRAKVACRLAVLGSSALLAGGALGSPAAASTRPAQASNPAQGAVVRQSNLSGLRAFVRQSDGGQHRVGLPKLVLHRLQTRPGIADPGFGCRTSRLPQRTPAPSVRTFGREIPSFSSWTWAARRRRLAPV